MMNTQELGRTWAGREVSPDHTGAGGSPWVGAGEGLLPGEYQPAGLIKFLRVQGRKQKCQRLKVITAPSPLERGRRNQEVSHGAQGSRLSGPSSSQPPAVHQGSLSRAADVRAFEQKHMSPLGADTVRLHSISRTKCTSSITLKIIYAKIHTEEQVLLTLGAKNHEITQNLK